MSFKQVGHQVKILTPKSKTNVCSVICDKFQVSRNFFRFCSLKWVTKTWLTHSSESPFIWFKADLQRAFTIHTYYSTYSNSLRNTVLEYIYHLVTEKFELHGFSYIFLEQCWFWPFKTALLKGKKISIFLRKITLLNWSILSLNTSTDLSYAVIFSARERAIVQGVTVFITEKAIINLENIYLVAGFSSPSE